MLWKGFQRPKRLEFERETLTDRFGRFYAQPFERGFGTTVGNALRRVLLSSIEGAAITAVQIDGVLHEFSPIKGVVEDATDIILNLKQLPLTCHVDYTKTLTLRKDKAGPGARLATSKPTPTSRSSSRMPTSRPSPRAASCTCSCASSAAAATSSADRNFDEDLGIGWIPIDSVHSPVKKVNYLVEGARIGQTTDYDKLTIEVWTNGSVTPRDAVSLSAKLIRDHLNIFVSLDEADDDAVGSGRRSAARRRRQRAPRQERRGARAVGALVQLPEEREHPDHPRAGAARPRPRCSRPRTSGASRSTRSRRSSRRWG